MQRRVARDAASNETDRDNLGNHVNQIYPRDALNRIQYMDAVNTNTGTTLNHEYYTYDSMDRINVVTSYTGSDSFIYYLDGELNQATLGALGHTLVYNLDKMGNRTSVVDNNVPSSYVPNTINQYTTGAGLSVSNGPEHEISSYNGVAYTYYNLRPHFTFTMAKNRFWSMTPVWVRWEPICMGRALTRFWSEPPSVPTAIGTSITRNKTMKAV
jgi:hypothetical protein